MDGNIATITFMFHAQLYSCFPPQRTSHASFGEKVVCAAASSATVNVNSRNNNKHQRCTTSPFSGPFKYLTSQAVATKT